MFKFTQKATISGVAEMSLFRTACLIFPAIVLAGCFGAKEPPPPPPPPTKVEIRIEAAADVNPGAQGQGAPVLLRIYELKELAGFNGADFFALYDKDQSALGGDLARKRELLLRSGEKQTLNFEAESGASFIAAYAAFRNLDSARWRVSAPIIPHRDNVFELKLGGVQMKLTALPLPPEPPVAPEK